MISTANPVAEPRLLWTERMPPAPLCDVPWLGNSIILSDGRVNFCCHSNGVAGNVNEQSFEEIWNGDVMRGIRRELAAQRLPVLCQTSSCPIYRGDTQHFLLDRSGKSSTNDGVIGKERRALMNEWCRGSTMTLRRKRRFGIIPALEIEIRIEFTGSHSFAADLLVGVASGGGQVLFLPSGQPAPEPLRFDIPIAKGSKYTVRSRVKGDGPMEVCAALFAANANPLAVNQCLWSSVASA